MRTKTVTPPHDYIPSELGREYLDLLGSQVDWIEQNPATAPTTSKKAMCEMILTQHKKNMSHLRLIFARFGDKTAAATAYDNYVLANYGEHCFQNFRIKGAINEKQKSKEPTA